ncbi:MAG: HNH endonuclease family protein, partial [Paludibacteraceae bacterium]
VYNDKEREAVIDTVTRDYPLNVMYWSVREDGTYEIIDGQQRTISICQYVSGAFAYMFRYFGNLTAEEQRQILDYELFVYLCKGTDKEKLKWFQTINIAGKKLTDQELLNAVYASAWLSDAKRYFSKPNCGAFLMGSKYVSGSPIQQDYLETVLRWISDNKIEDYMARHSLTDKDAGRLWAYYQAVISWVQQTFIKYRKEMKGLDWGSLYNTYQEASRQMNPNETEQEVARLMADSDVVNKRGIYRYVFTRDEHCLSIRAFDDNMRREVYERQGGICPACGRHFEIEEMDADHITPWSKGGRTVAANCQMLCKECNRRKSNK